MSDLIHFIIRISASISFTRQLVAKCNGVSELCAIRGSISTTLFRGLYFSRVTIEFLWCEVGYRPPNLQLCRHATAIAQKVEQATDSASRLIHLHSQQG